MFGFAVQPRSVGSGLSRAISEARELTDEYIKGDLAQACNDVSAMRITQVAMEGTIILDFLVRAFAMVTGRTAYHQSVRFSNEKKI